jgi:hypothetical protein
MQSGEQFGGVHAAHAGIGSLWLVKAFETAPLVAMPQPALIPWRPFPVALPELEPPLLVPAELAPVAAAPLLAPVVATPLLAPVAETPLVEPPDETPLIEPLAILPLLAPEPGLPDEPVMASPLLTPDATTVPDEPALASPLLVPPLTPALEPDPALTPDPALVSGVGLPLHAALTTKIAQGIVRNQDPKFMDEVLREKAALPAHKELVTAGDPARHTIGRRQAVGRQLLPARYHYGKGAVAGSSASSRASSRAKPSP